MLDRNDKKDPFAGAFHEDGRGRGATGVTEKYLTLTTFICNFTIIKVTFTIKNVR